MGSYYCFGCDNIKDSDEDMCELIAGDLLCEKCTEKHQEKLDGVSDTPYTISTGLRKRPTKASD